jgi:hypothetical protein
VLLEEALDRGAETQQPGHDAATAATAAAIADPSASLADVERAAGLEEAVLTAYLERPGAEAELEADI